MNTIRFGLFAALFEMIVIFHTALWGWLKMPFSTRDRILSLSVILSVSFVSTLILVYFFDSGAMAPLAVICGAICYRIPDQIMLGDPWYSFSAENRMNFIFCLLGILAGILV